MAMGKPDPQKRKPLHASTPLDEITDNVKNSAVVTRSKLKKRMENSHSDDSSEDVITSDSGSEDEIYDGSLEKITFKVSSNAQIKKRSNVNIKNIDYNEKYGLNKNNLIKISDELLKVRGKQLESDKQNLKNLNASNKTKNDTNYILYIILFFIISLLFYYCISREVIATNDIKETSDTNHAKSTLHDVTVTLKSMQSKYKNQPKELWKNAYVAIRSIVDDPTKPSIILLLGDKSDPLDCLAVLLGNVSSNALNSKILILTPEKFNTDMGTVIESFKRDAQNNKAVIIWDLLNINTEALKAFHNLCDRINPLVKEVIFIITIITDDYDKKITPLKFIEEALFNKLSGKIKQDAIQPLITRITDGPILTVKPEPNIEDCPLPKATKKS